MSARFTRSGQSLGPKLGDQLTGREQEVARLIAEGLTNQEIAARLVVVPKTVEFHISQIRVKWGLVHTGERRLTIRACRESVAA